MFKEKLFNFMSELQGKGQTDLQRQGVRDLSTAITVMDCLVN